MPEQDFIYSPLGEQITPTPKRLIKFTSLDSILNFPSVGKLPNDQQFICPNCDSLTTGFPCEHCGYEDEGLFDDNED